MAEYIEREAVLKTAKDGNHSDFERSMADLTSLREVLEDTLTADVAEVRHGEFVLVQNGKGICSNCHRLDSIDKIAKYCRYCGAKMDGKAVDENE